MQNLCCSQKENQELVEPVPGPAGSPGLQAKVAQIPRPWANAKVGNGRRRKTNDDLILGLKAGRGLARDQLPSLNMLDVKSAPFIRDCRLQTAVVLQNKRGRCNEMAGCARLCWHFNRGGAIGGYYQNFGVAAFLQTLREPLRYPNRHSSSIHHGTTFACWRASPCFRSGPAVSPFCISIYLSSTHTRFACCCFGTGQALP